MIDEGDNTVGHEQSLFGVDRNEFIDVERPATAIGVDTHRMLGRRVRDDLAHARITLQTAATTVSNAEAKPYLRRPLSARPAIDLDRISSRWRPLTNAMCEGI